MNGICEWGPLFNDMWHTLQVHTYIYIYIHIHIYVHTIHTHTYALQRHVAYAAGTHT